MERDGPSWTVQGERFDTVVSTIPPQLLAAMTGLPLTPIPYQGAACMTLALDREVTNGIYWLNMKDEAPYGAVVAHTNFVPVERYGEHLVYLASYFAGDFRPGTATGCSRTSATVSVWREMRSAGTTSRSTRSPGRSTRPGTGG